MDLVAITAVAIVGIGLFWFISTSNQFTRYEHLLKESWANVDIALKRRHDLIPNLIETVKAHAVHERELLERLVQLREAAVSDPSATNENQLSQALSIVVARVEGYPELRSSESYLALMQELVNTEDRIAAARRFYNANVRDFNILRESFPASLLAGDRREAEPYEIESAEVRAVLPAITIPHADVKISLQQP